MDDKQRQEIADLLKTLAYHRENTYQYWYASEYTQAQIRLRFEYPKRLVDDVKATLIEKEADE